MHVMLLLLPVGICSVLDLFALFYYFTCIPTSLCPDFEKVYLVLLQDRDLMRKTPSLFAKRCTYFLPPVGTRPIRDATLPPSFFLSFFLFGGRKGVGSATQPSARLRTDADVGGNDLWVNLPCFTATVSALASRSGPHKGAAASNCIRPLTLIQVSAIQDYDRRGHPNKKQRSWIIYKLRPQAPRRRAFADDLYLSIPQR